MTAIKFTRKTQDHGENGTLASHTTPKYAL